MGKLISVIVPIYNVEPYLERCIESIRNQTYNNLEIILVDDGSKDGCGIICDHYEKLDSRIKVIHKVNGGLSDARNAGIEIATGDYFAFIDSDDFIHHTMYEKLMGKMLETNADIAICNLKYTYEGTESEIDVNESTQQSDTIVFDRMQAQLIYFDKQYNVISTVAWNKLYKKSVFDQIRYPKGKIHEDEFTTFKLLYHSQKIVYLTEQLYFYFQKKDSIMAQFNENRFHLFEAYRHRMEFYSDNNEFELFKKMLMLYIRMSAQFMKWSKDKQSNYIELIRSDRSKLKEIYLKNKKKIRTTMMGNLELMVYFFDEKIYFKLWKWKNGNSTHSTRNSGIN